MDLPCKILGVIIATASLSPVPIPARAEDCSLKLMASLPMTVMSSGRFTVPVSVNGESHQFLLDTGAVFSSLAESVAKTQGITVRELPGMNLYEADGTRVHRGTAIDSFKLGNNEAKNFHMLVEDMTNSGFDGTLGPDILQAFDVELDFGNEKVNLFSQDHCPGKVVYWAKDYAEIPFKMTDGYHINMRTALEDHTLDTEFDTGSAITLLSAEFAQQAYGVEPGSPDTTPMPGATAQSLVRYEHRFNALTLDGVSVKNPVVALLPDDMENSIRKQNDSKSANDPVYGLQFNIPRLIVGEDVIHQLHVYIAYKEQKLYVTNAGAH